MKKRIIAFLIIVLMLTAMFSACQTDTPSDDDSGKDQTDQTDTGKDKDNDVDNPVEIDPLHLSFLQRDSNIVGYTEAINADYATLKYIDEQALIQNNIIVDRTPINNDAYKTTVSGMIAAGTMLDGFYSGNTLDLDIFNNYVKLGMFANFDDILEHSSGLARDLLSPGGEVAYIRALGLMEDGGWYRMSTPDGNGTYLNLDHDDVDYINNWPLHTWYNLAIRRDWLDKCSLDMPQTTEQFKQALIAFQENDCNNSGAKDERAMLGIAMANDFTSGVLFSNGVAQWFGLPNANFSMDAATGEITNGIEYEGFVPFATFMKEIYDAGLVISGEGNAWTYTVNCAGNNASCYIQYPGRMMEVSCELGTGDPNAQYDQMPIIQAVEGIKPTIIGQSSTAANEAISFMVDANYDAVAAYLDFIYSETFFITLMYGLEGYGWDYNPDGSVTLHEIADQAEDYSYGDCWHYLCGNFYPQIQIGWVWDFNKNIYSDFQDALDNGEPFKWRLLTEEQWNENNSKYNWDNYSPEKQYYMMISDIGLENLNVRLNTSYLALPTDAEAEIISLYQTDLRTYLAEMATGYIVGTKSIDNYETDLQYAYDNLGFAEYTAVIQTRCNRYFEAIGREPYNG